MNPTSNSTFSPQHFNAASFPFPYYTEEEDEVQQTTGSEPLPLSNLFMHTADLWRRRCQIKHQCNNSSCSESWGSFPAKRNPCLSFSHFQADNFQPLLYHEHQSKQSLSSCIVRCDRLSMVKKSFLVSVSEYLHASLETEVKLYFVDTQEEMLLHKQIPCNWRKQTMEIALGCYLRFLVLTQRQRDRTIPRSHSSVQADNKSLKAHNASVFSSNLEQYLLIPTGMMTKQRVQQILPALCHLRTAWAQEHLQGQGSESCCGRGRFQLPTRTTYFGRALY